MKLKINKNNYLKIFFIIIVVILLVFIFALLIHKRDNISINEKRVERLSNEVLTIEPKSGNNVLLRFKKDEGIKKIKYPNGNEIYCNRKK